MGFNGILSEKQRSSSNISTFIAKVLNNATLLSADKTNNNNSIAIINSKIEKNGPNWCNMEHESLTQELEKSQRKLLKVARDSNFLLDRLLQYEQVVSDSPEDSDATLSSDSDSWEPPLKKKNSGSSNTVRAIKQEAIDRKDVTVNEEKNENNSTSEKVPIELLEVVADEVPKTEETSSSNVIKPGELEIDVQMSSDKPS